MKAVVGPSCTPQTVVKPDWSQCPSGEKFCTPFPNPDTPELASFPPALDQIRTGALEL